MAIGAAYSPDGLQMVVLAQNLDGDGTNDRLVIASSRGGSPRVIADAPDYPTPGVVLDWTPTNLLVPSPPNWLVTLGGLAPWQLTD